MAVLEIKLRRANDDGVNLHLEGVVYSTTSGKSFIDKITGQTRSPLVRTFLDGFAISVPTGSNVGEQVKLLASKYYDKLNASQKIVVTDILANQKSK